MAAFGEEMIYRGYLMNRAADLLNRARMAWTVSVITVQIVFGFAHSYQGWTGVIDEGIMGLLLAALYLYPDETSRCLSLHTESRTLSI